MKERIHKFVNQNISFITELENQTIRGISENEIHGRYPVCIIRKASPKGYALRVLHPGHGEAEDCFRPGIIETSTGKKLNVNRFKPENWGTSIKSGKRPYSHMKGILDVLQSPYTHPDEAYFRVIHPIPKNFNAFYYFETELLSSDGEGNRWGLLNIQMGNNRFHVYGEKLDRRYYLIVDSCQPMSQEEFEEFCWSINIGLSIFNGKLWQNECYIFSYEESSMENTKTWSFTTLRPHLSSIYAMVATNPSSWVRDHDKHLSDAYEGNAYAVNHEVVSNLCTWVHSKDAHRVVALLIAEAKKTSLLMMPAGFALVLESLATIFEEWFEEKTVPIPNKTTAKKIRSKLKEALGEWASDPAVNMAILTSKIDQLNSPTNRERLKIPFQILQIPLSEADEIALDYRNAILHGNVTLEPSSRKKFEMDEIELAMRLMTLANAIIFKWVGYTGWIVNHVKTQERVTHKRIDEPYFRNLGNEEGIDPAVLSVARWSSPAAADSSKETL